jgi:hypothetical protein
VCRLEAQSAAASVLKNTVKKPKALKPADFKAFGGRPFCKKSTANRLRAKSPLNAIVSIRIQANDGITPSENGFWTCAYRKLRPYKQ